MTIAKEIMMDKFKGMMTSLSPHWATPDWLYKELNKEFQFNDDPCPLKTLQEKQLRG